MSEEKTIQDKIDERRMKICTAHERAEITIVVESMIYFEI